MTTETQTLMMIVPVMSLDRLMLQKLAAMSGHDRLQTVRMTSTIMDGLGADGVTESLVGLVASIPAWQATMEAGMADCGLCGRPCDPADEKTGMTLLAAYETKAQAMGDIDDARMLCCPRCMSKGKGTWGGEMIAAHMLKIGHINPRPLSVGGGGLRPPTAQGFRGPEDMSRKGIFAPGADRGLNRAARRAEKARGSKSAGGKNPAEKPGASPARSAAVDALLSPLEETRVLSTIVVSNAMPQWRVLPQDCLGCGCDPAGGEVCVGALPCDMMMRPIQGAAGPWWRLCPGCVDLSDEAIRSKVVAALTAAGHEAGAVD